jgi:xanthine dehydrogenase FAD-binding subunit
MAAVLDLDPEGNVREIRLAWGSVGPVIVTCPEAEALLRGRPPASGELQDAARAVRRRVAPISDVRATASYRRRVAGNLLLRLSRYAPAGQEGSPA